MYAPFIWANYLHPPWTIHEISNKGMLFHPTDQTNVEKGNCSGFESITPTFSFHSTWSSAALTTSCNKSWMLYTLVQALHLHSVWNIILWLHYKINCLFRISTASFHLRGQICNNKHCTTLNVKRLEMAYFSPAVCPREH